MQVSILHYNVALSDCTTPRLSEGPRPAGTLADSSKADDSRFEASHRLTRPHFESSTRSSANWDSAADSQLSRALHLHQLAHQL